MSRNIFHFGADGARHRVDNPRSKPRSPGSAFGATSNAVVLDDEFGAPPAERLQMDTYFALPIRVSVLESIGHPLGHDHAEIDAQVRFQSQRLEIVSQGGAV